MSRKCYRALLVTARLSHEIRDIALNVELFYDIIVIVTNHYVFCIGGRIMLIALSRLFHLFVLGVLITQYSKHRFNKHNIDNALLITLSGILLTVFEKEYV